MRSTLARVAAGIIVAASIVSAEEYGIDVNKGCYSAVDDYVFNSTYTWMTDGWCQKLCAPLGYNAMATTKGSDCWCGKQIPDQSVKVADTNCNSKCTGFGEKMCGGAKAFTVYTTGLVDESLVVTAGGSSSTTSVEASSSNTPSATVSVPPSVVTVGGETVVVTAGSTISNTASPSASSVSGGGGPNKAAIAAGVVVGIVAIAAIAGGIFIFIRNKNRREVEEEYRRNAAVSSFIANGGKPPSTSGGASFNDTRLDPVMAQRRMSDGSIADNEDYSRRILKVTNA